MGKLTFLVGALAVLRLVGHFTDPMLSSAQIHRVIGEPARLEVMEPRGSLRVVTWNIEQGVRFSDIARELRRMEADVVLLQEADIACQRSGNRNVPRDIAEALDMNWVAAGQFQEIGESSRGVPALTTQAILSRYPISAASAIRFESQALLRWKLNPVQPRRGARIALKARTAGVQIYNAHIESVGNEALRTRQMQQILEDYAQVAAAGEPAVIAGDFNNIPASRSPMFRALGEGGFESALKGAAMRTSVGNNHPIDWIFVSGFAAEGQVRNTGDASDHFAVIADLTPTAPQPDGRERFLHTATMQTR